MIHRTAGQRCFGKKLQRIDTCSPNQGVVGQKGIATEDKEIIASAPKDGLMSGGKRGLREAVSKGARATVNRRQACIGGSLGQGHDIATGKAQGLDRADTTEE